MCEKTFRNIIKMVAITLVILVIAGIWIIEKSYGTNLISNSNDGLA
jgi:hypothetical protein